VSERQPKLFGRAFPNASGKRRLVTVGVGTALIVSGTHISCVVTNVPRALAVTCGLTVPAHAGS